MGIFIGSILVLGFKKGVSVFRISCSWVSIRFEDLSLSPDFSDFAIKCKNWISSRWDQMFLFSLCVRLLQFLLDLYQLRGDSNAEHRSDHQRSACFFFPVQSAECHGLTIHAFFFSHPLPHVHAPISDPFCSPPWACTPEEPQYRIQLFTWYLLIHFFSELA